MGRVKKQNLNLLKLIVVVQTQWPNWWDVLFSIIFCAYFPFLFWKWNGIISNCFQQYECKHFIKQRLFYFFFFKCTKPFAIICYLVKKLYSFLLIHSSCFVDCAKAHEISFKMKTNYEEINNNGKMSSTQTHTHTHTNIPCRNMRAFCWHMPWREAYRKAIKKPFQYEIKSQPPLASIHGCET